MDWILANIKWILILVIVPILLAIIKASNKKNEKNEIGLLPKLNLENNNSSSNNPSSNNNSSNNNNLTVNNFINSNEENNKDCEKDNLENLKLTKKILFVDDDTKFKVVSILKKSGWIHTKSVKDIDSYDSKDVLETDIFFC